MHSQFTHINNFKYEVCPLGMGNFSISIMPPKKSAQNKFYPVVNFNNYNATAYTDQHNMASATARFRVFGIVHLPSMNQTPGSYDSKELMYSTTTEDKLREDIQNFLNYANQTNLWAPENLGMSTFTLHFANEGLLEFQSTIMNINGAEVTGFNLSAGGTYGTAVSVNSFIYFLNQVLGRSLDDYRENMLIMYQNASIQMALDALLVNQGIFAGVDYRQGATSIVGGNGNFMQSSNNGNNGFNYGNSNALQNNSQPTKSVKPQSNPFGNINNVIHPSAGSGRDVFPDQQSTNNIQQQKDVTPKTNKTSIDALASQMNSNNNTPKQLSQPETQTVSHENVTPSQKEEVQRQERQPSIAEQGKGLLAGFKPTGKFEDKVSEVVKEDDTSANEIQSNNPFENPATDAMVDPGDPFKGF